MPKIQWIGLPQALRDHLFERLRERKITAEDLYQLKAWRESEPEAPESWRAAPEFEPRAPGSERLASWPSAEPRQGLLRVPAPAPGLPPEESLD